MKLIHILTPQEFGNMYFSFNNDENFETKKDELSTEKKINVYTEVDDKGQKHIAE